jgi:enamine deaminase RidA (YjgF/YER057c/UK114 family)
MPSPKPVNSNPPDFPPYAPTYSHISTVLLAGGSKLISFAGQIGHDPVSNQIPASFASQVSLALANLDICLKAASATKEDIVQVRQYVVGMSKFSKEEMKARADIYSKFMGDTRPPSTLVGVESLAAKEMLYEIEVIAIVNM